MLRDWRLLERRGGTNIIYAAVGTFACVITLVFIPQTVGMTLFGAAILWAGIALICASTVLCDECRQWQDYHSWRIANPHAWPWPPCPGQQ